MMIRFDEKLNEHFKVACETSLAEVPELRSVIVIFDYAGGLRDASDISKGLWLSQPGSKEAPDAVLGALSATLQTFEHLLFAAKDVVSALEIAAIAASERVLANDTK